MGSSTLLAELSFRDAFDLVRVVRVACLRSHVLRTYCNFESKQAISVTLFGRRPNNKDGYCQQSSQVHRMWSSQGV